jgi:hypothetical protein
MSKRIGAPLSYVLGAASLVFAANVFLFPRIMLVAARAITYGTPLIGTVMSVYNLRKAETRGAKIRYGSLLTMNLASMAYFGTILLSMIDWDDDEEDEAKVKFLGLTLNIKKSPPISAYGEDINEWDKEPLKIEVNGKMIERPEIALQVGDRRPLTMRYAPWFLTSHVMLAKILEKAQYEVKSVNRVTGEQTVELQSIGLGDLAMALASALGAGTLNLAFESLDRIIRDTKGLFDDNPYVKDKAYTDLIYTITNPLKLATRPKALQEISQTVSKGVSVVRGEEYNEPKATTATEALFKDLGFSFITPFNDIMDNYNYDEWGITKPKTLSAPKGINSWISVVDNIIGDAPRLPENWDSEYADYKANSKLTNISKGRNVAVPKVDFQIDMMHPEYYGIKNYTIEQRSEINRTVRLAQANLLLDAPLETKKIRDLSDDVWATFIKDYKNVGAESAIGEIMKLHIDKYGGFSKDGQFTPLPFDVDMLRKYNDKLEKEVLKKSNPQSE